MRQDLMDRMLANLVGVKPDLTAGDTKRFVSFFVLTSYSFFVLNQMRLMN